MDSRPLGPIGRARQLRRPVGAPDAPGSHVPNATGNQQQNEQDQGQSSQPQPQCYIVLNPGEVIAHPHPGLDRTNPLPPGDRLFGNPANDTARKPDSQEPPASPHSHLNPADAYSAQALLINRLPAELIDQTLDYAEYFPCEVIGKREGEEHVGGNGSKVYLKCKIPEFEAMEKDTIGKGGQGGGRPGRVRKLVFRLRSKDQGWSSDIANRGTYKGSYSWIDAELWRKSDGLTPTHNTATGEEENQTPDANINPAIINNPLQPKPTNTSSNEQDEKETESYIQVGGPHLLQRNLHAAHDFTDHEIVWDWAEPILPDDDDTKWEPGVDGGWYRDGHTRDAEFIKALRGGDEVWVVMRCMYPGWACRMASCEVEMYWAV